MPPSRLIFVNNRHSIIYKAWAGRLPYVVLKLVNKISVKPVPVECIIISVYKEDKVAP